VGAGWRQAAVLHRATPPCRPGPYRAPHALYAGARAL